MLVNAILFILFVLTGQKFENILSGFSLLLNQLTNEKEKDDHRNCCSS